MWLVGLIVNPVTSPGWGIVFEAFNILQPPLSNKQSEHSQAAELCTTPQHYYMIFNKKIFQTANNEARRGKVEDDVCHDIQLKTPAKCTSL